MKTMESAAVQILHTKITPTSYMNASRQVLEWAFAGNGRYVCAANVHMLMEAHDAPDFADVVNQADLVVPDGMPLVWLMRLKGMHEQQRVYGPTLMLHVLELASSEHIPVGFFGGSPQVLDLLVSRMKQNFPGLQVAFQLSPPYRDLSAEEDVEITNAINRSGTRILLVGLGCPKQEKWMAAHRDKIKAVMLGVGAGFDFHAGLKPQAPAWLQQLGMEWFFRLISEPHRLWRRYILQNPRFIFLAILDLLGLIR